MIRAVRRMVRTMERLTRRWAYRAGLLSAPNAGVEEGERILRRLHAVAEARLGREIPEREIEDDGLAGHRDDL